MKHTTLSKRIAALLVGVSTLLLFTACGGGSTPAETTAAPTPETTAAVKESSAPATSEAPTQETTAVVKESSAPATSEAPKKEETKPLLPEVKAEKAYKIGYCLSRHDTFLDNMLKVMYDNCKAQGLTLDVVSADNNGEVQVSQISQFSEQGFDGIIVNPASGSVSVDTYLEAAKGKPVIFVNREPNGDQVKGKSAYVGCDELQFGKYQGEALAKYFKDAGKTEAKYVMFRGVDGLKNTMQRADGALSALEAAGIKPVEVMTATGDYFREKARGEMMNFLVTKKEFDCVIAANDDMALGAIQAMKEAGIDVKTHPVVGIDATQAGCEAVKNGDMLMTVLQNADLQGSTTITAIISLIQGQEIEPIINIPIEVVDASNVASFLK